MNIDQTKAAEILLRTITKTLVQNGDELTMRATPCQCRELENHNFTGIYTVDLNVNFKSGMELAIVDGQLKCFQRYDGVDEIDSLRDLMSIYTYWRGDAESRWAGGGKWTKGWEALAELADKE